jgi:glycosidase
MKHVEWSKNANIYEVNIRQYTSEGTINAFRPHLSRLKEMGVDIIWIMPVQPIGEKNRKGSLGSYYSIKDYSTVNHEYGSLDDFKGLVDDAHKMGMYVLLDWVANHSAWDNIWTISHPDFYRKDEYGKFDSPWDWTDVIAFNYENREMRKAMIDAMKFWLTETDIDGFRCDMAGMVPVDFWEEARAELEKTKPLFMLAEDEENADLLSFAFDMNFTWEMHHLMNAIAKEQAKASDVWWKLGAYNEKFPADVYRMYFTSNHDENSHSGTAVERMGESTMAFAVLTYILPGMPLIYSGQETMTDKRLAFFEKDEIDWSEVKLHDFYKTLNKLKTSNKALWNGSFGGSCTDINKGKNDHMFACYRENEGHKLIAILNLSRDEQLFTIENNHLSGKYTDVFLNEEVYPGPGYTFELKPWGFTLLSNQAL